MACDLQLAASAERALERLPEFAAAAIVEFMTGPLIESPHRTGRPLSFELEGYRSARRGAYRVIYRIVDEHVVRVVRIGHRADIYGHR